MASSSLGVYLHAPFCVSHCTYCDFYTRAFQDDTQVRGFADALIAEIALTAESLGLRGRRVDTLYLGGGTPSLLDPVDVNRILDRVAAVFAVESGCEISLEANPESVTLEKLRAFLAAGVNRISLGVQSFQPPVLETLGRAHGREIAREAFLAARRAGFTNVNLDLMLALPGQSLSSVREDLEMVGRLGPEHLSAYLLEMDKESALRSRIESGEIAPPTDEEAAAMYRMTDALLVAEGYRHYEISSFGRPGCECRHNLKYWTDQPFLGCGPSAWSYLDSVRSQVARDLEGYLEAARQGRLPVREEERRSREERWQEAIFAGLRLLDGIDVEAVARAYGVIDALPPREGALRDLEEAGLIHREGPRLRLTPRGLPLANEVFRVFV